MRSISISSVEQKDGAKINIWFFLKVIVGSVLLLKGCDGLLPVFGKSSYGPEAQHLFKTIESLPSVNIAIMAFHFILGGVILWNILIPLSLLVSLPVFILAFVFEFLYGTAMFPQVLALLGLISCCLLLYHYRGYYKAVFKN